MTDQTTFKPAVQLTDERMRTEFDRLLAAAAEAGVDPGVFNPISLYGDVTGLDAMLAVGAVEMGTDGDTVTLKLNLSQPAAQPTVDERVAAKPSDFAGER
jgi:hypothetical protein